MRPDFPEVLIAVLLLVLVALWVNHWRVGKRKELR
jgi:hypothetical protein